MRHLLLVLSVMSLRAADWPAWRGLEGQGASVESGLPTSWTATSNVVWKVPLPGPGNSTPIVVGERVFLTQAENQGRLRSLLCLRLDDGRRRHRRRRRLDDGRHGRHGRRGR